MDFFNIVVHIYGKLRAHHRIHQEGHQDYYARLIAENKEYWAPVKLASGRWATSSDHSRRAKLARHRRYKLRRGNAVYKQKVNDMEAEEEEAGEEESMEDEYMEDEDW